MVGMKIINAWPELAFPPALSPGEVHLWRVKVPEEAAMPSSWLGLIGPAERESVARKRTPTDARRSLTSRACLRLLLGAYLELPAGELVLSATAAGKPILAGAAGPKRIEFNVSHSGEWVLLGFSRGQALGVDVELARDLDFDDLVRNFFSVAERIDWAATPPGERSHVFFTTWVRKEAYLKALGVGLQKQLDSFTVTVGAGSTPRVLWCADAPEASREWHFATVDIEASYFAALAVDSGVETVRMFTFLWR